MAHRVKPDTDFLLVASIDPPLVNAFSVGIEELRILNLIPE